MGKRAEIEKQILKYRQLLLDAKTIEIDKNYLKQYNDHFTTLDEINNAFTKGDNHLLFDLIERESRYYGWSYLPNKYGEEAEAAFWDLKKIIVDE